MTSSTHRFADPNDYCDALLTIPPYAIHENVDSLFVNALAEEINFHAASNSIYRDFLARKSFDPTSPFTLEDIPFIPVQIFKILGPELRTVSASDVQLTLSSSATSGIPSAVPIDSITARREARCMALTIADRIGKKRRPFLVLDEDPRHGKSANAYGARVAAVRGYLNFASKAQYFVEDTTNGLVFLDDAFSHAIFNLDADTPIVLFGFTYVLYSTVVEPCLNRDLHFHLPKDSYILHIGGWKKLESQKVSREDFLKDLETVFGVPPDHVVDVYGFTEQMGLNYPDCQCGCKHTPNMSRILVRDQRTHNVLPPGQPGLLEFISPLPHSYPGVAVLTDDIGVIEPGVCPFGRCGTRFRVLGRAKKAEVRGCGDIMGEKMRGGAQSIGEKNEKRQTNQN